MLSDNSTHTPSGINPALIEYIKKHGIRTVPVSGIYHIVARDAIKALGYAETSIQPLINRYCHNRQLIELETLNGKTRVNVIPIDDFIFLALRCKLAPSYAIRSLIIEQAALTQPAASRQPPSVTAQPYSSAPII